MRLKKSLLLLSLVAIGLVACNNTEDPEPDTNTPVDPETPVEETISVDNVLETLQSDTLIYEVELDFPSDNFKSTSQGYISKDRYWYEQTFHYPILDTVLSVLVDSLDIWKTDDGYVGSPKIDLTTNDVVIDITEYTIFDERFYNPFTLLNADNATVDDNVISFDIEYDTGVSLLYMLNFWYLDEYNEVTLDVVVDTTKEEISYIELVFDEDAYATITILDEEDINLPELLTRETTSDTDKLQSALNALAEADSLYVEVSMTQIGGSTSTEAEIYYDGISGNIISYDNTLDWYGYGATNTTEGLVNFAYLNGYYFSADTYPGYTVKDMLPSYKVLACMFDLQDDGTYLFAMDGQESELLDLFLIESFAIGDYYPDAGTLIVSVDETGGEITGISYTYECYSRLTVEVSVTIGGVSLISPEAFYEYTSLNSYTAVGFGDVDTLNYTQTTTSGTRTWSVDQTTGNVIGEPTVTEETGTIVYVDGDVRQYGEYGESGSSYSINTENGFDHYTYDSTSQEYTLDSTYSNSGMKWQDNFNHGNELMDYLLNDLEKESDTLASTTDETKVAKLANYIGYNNLNFNDSYATLSIDIQALTLTLEVVYSCETYYTDSELTELVYSEHYVSTTFSNIWSTSIDTSVLGI